MKIMDRRWIYKDIAMVNAVPLAVNLYQLVAGYAGRLTGIAIIGGLSVTFLMWLLSWLENRELEAYGRAVHQPWGAGAKFTGWKKD